MGTGLAAVRQFDPVDRAERAVQGLEDQWLRGEPDLDEYWAEADCDKLVSVLAALVKVDMRCRYERGERPTVADYFRRYPALCEHSERVISLVYEEFCLCEEHGEQPDPERFCDRYDLWRGSLASQLRYHRDFSQVVGAPVPSPQFPEAGERFEQFQLHSLMGQGGSARVFLAHDDSMGGREVVLKISADRGNEPSIMGKLDHMHIVPVLRVAMQPERGLRGLSMPYRPGLPLDVIIKKVNPASPPRSAQAIWNALVPAGSAEGKPSATHSGWQSFPIHGTYEQGVAWIVARLAEALAYSHLKGILHRDVKPANVLLTLRNGPQLLDFNLAHEPHSADQARAALRGGTLPYMAPEQLDAYIDPVRWDTVGAAAELYSLGLLMHEMLTGEPPEVPNQKLPLPRAIRELLDRRSEARVSPRVRNPTVSHALEGIISRCLMFAPEKRYPDANALAEDLHRFLERRPLRYASNASARERTRNWLRRSWLYLVLVTALSIALGALLLPHVLWVIPIENRWAFQEAVESVVEDPSKAMRMLDPLVKEYPQSALVWLYRGLAHQKAGSQREAIFSYTTALGLPDVGSELGAWKTREPDIDIARLLVDVGGYLYEGQYYRLANRAGELAASLNPRIFEAQYLIAREQLRIGRYERAFEGFSKIIEAANSQNSLASRNRLIACYEKRAKVSHSQGDKARGRRQPESADVSKGHYEEAMKDVELGEELLTAHSSDNVIRENYTILKARIKLSLADITAETGKTPEAAVLYRDAKKLLEGLSPDVKQSNDVVAMLQEIIKRLHGHADLHPADWSSRYE